MAADLLPPEGLIAGKYRLTRLLGQGGMGTVWEGVHESLGTRVAVKFIDAEYASSDDVRARFVNEAKAAARLRSKHVVQVYDQGVGADGRPYIVMEFLPGEPLDRRLDRLGRLSPAETARTVLHVCRALARAHESGIVHRDLKPENVFIVRDDEDETDIAKVVDFGIAKFVDAQAGTSSTRTGAVLGTPQFMSPEQARGLRSVDHRTDLWSLGVIAYRCLVGVLPFKGEAVGDLLVNICTSDAPVPSAVEPTVPPGFDGWARRALAREPGDRFQSAAELADALSVVCGMEGRLGSALATRLDAPSPSESGAIPRGAVTAAPLATTPAPSGRRKAPGDRPPWALLGGLFALVTVVAVVGARAVMHAGPEPSGSAVTRGAPVPESGAGNGTTAPPPPEVTPVTTAAASSAAVPPAPTPGGPPRAHAAASADPARKSRGGKPAPSPVAEGGRPPAARPSRPPDLLGY